MHIFKVGHLNPLTSILSELSKQRRVKVIAYATDDAKASLERAGAEYRPYPFFPLADAIKKGSTGKFKIGRLFNLLLVITERNMNELMAVMDEEPDLIVYDEMAVHVKFLLAITRTRIDPRTGSPRVQPAVMIRPHFATQQDVYPNKHEDSFYRPKLDQILSLISPLIKLLWMNWRYGLGWQLFGLFHLLVGTHEGLMINTVAPELQPRAHLFDKRNKFVGCCIDERIVAWKPVMAKSEAYARTQSFIDLFEPVNPMCVEEKVRRNMLSPLRLVFASFGTVLNNQEQAYVKIIDGVRRIRGSEQLRVIIATGDRLKALLDQKIASGELHLPDNVLLVGYAPQLEILKRASLFITHCGMNSVS